MHRTCHRYFFTLKHRILSLCPKKSNKNTRPTPSEYHSLLARKQSSSEIEALRERDRLLRQICERVKTFDDYDEEYDTLNRHNLFPEFLVYGNHEVILKEMPQISRFDACYINDKDVLKALHVSLQNGQHVRFVSLLEVAEKRFAKQDVWSDMRVNSPITQEFMEELFEHSIFPNNGMLVKRLLTLHVQDFMASHPKLFEFLFKEFVCRLYLKAKHDPKMKKMLIDLVGQPSLLTERIFAQIFLDSCIPFFDSIRRDFIAYGWKEAIEEGLKESIRVEAKGCGW